MKKTIATLTATMISLFFAVLSHGGELPARITIIDAINIAAEKTDGEVIKAELEDGIYEIKIKKEKDGIEKIYLDAATGKPIKKATISLDEATALAVKEVPGKVLKVEFERGRYEIKIRTAAGALKKVFVDGESGMILEVKEKKEFLR